MSPFKFCFENPTFRHYTSGTLFGYSGVPVRDETGAVAPFCDATVWGAVRRELDPNGLKSIASGFFKSSQPNMKEKTFALSILKPGWYVYATGG